MRLHVLVLAFTYVVFPLLGLATRVLSPWLITPELYVGLVFLGALPSTVQSSIAFTSLARGNVAAALCAASASNLLGVLVTPLLVALMLSGQGVSLSTDSIQKLVLQLLVPFALGQRSGRASAASLCGTRGCSGGRPWIDLGSSTARSARAWSRHLAAGLARRVVGARAVCTCCSRGDRHDHRGSRRLGFRTADEIAIVFCGSRRASPAGCRGERAVSGEHRQPHRAAADAVSSDPAGRMRVAGAALCGRARIRSARASPLARSTGERRRRRCACVAFGTWWGPAAGTTRPWEACGPERLDSGSSVVRQVGRTDAPSRMTAEGALGLGCNPHLSTATHDAQDD